MLPNTTPARHVASPLFERAAAASRSVSLEQSLVSPALSWPRVRCDPDSRLAVVKGDDGTGLGRLPVCSYRR